MDGLKRLKKAARFIAAEGGDGDLDSISLYFVLPDLATTNFGFYPPQANVMAITDFIWNAEY